MGFQKAKKEVKFGKVSVQGKEKSGKTTTGSMLAIDTAKRFHPGKPVAFLSSEPGVDFVIELFEKEGVELLVDRRKDFVALKNAIPEAIKAGAGVLLIDSATAFWNELVSTYAEEHNIKKLQPFHYTPIKAIWRQFYEQFVPAKLDIIVCGRIGYEFEELVDDQGERTAHRVDTKMKSEGDMNYETDLIIEMVSRPDEEAGNAKKRKNKLQRTFEANNVHIATVKGCRVWSLNGQVFKFKAAKEYKAGMAAEVGKCFSPYFDFLKKGDAQGNVLDVRDSRELFKDANQEVRRTRFIIALEEIKGALSTVFSGDTGKDAAIKKDILNEIFSTHSWTAVEKLHIEALEWGMKVCIKLKALCLESKPETRDDLVNLVKQAKDEVRFEAHIPDDKTAAAVEEKQIDQSLPF